ncbi:MAG: NRDE family protein [Gammaproteobacteria bacterium]|nr:MAG: NRDE family protein [Gammaproteobacteria bacterium]
MCLIVCAFNHHVDYPLVMVANRDEFHDRPTQPAAFWDNGILAGRDLQGGGTWMGVTGRGRFAAVTNYREAVRANSDAPSRGDLVIGFLESDLSAPEWLEKMKPGMERYNGFSLLVGAAGDPVNLMAYLSNREGDIRVLTPGIYGMSNHLLETPWPKVVRSKAALEKCMLENCMDDDSLLDILSDSSAADDESLPDTGLDQAIERMLAPPFVVSESYGTRSTTVVVIGRNGELRFVERSFDSSGSVTGEERYAFPLENYGC